MLGSQYQVVAEVPVDDAALLDRIQSGLSRTFKVDLSTRRIQLRRGGVCLCRVDSLQLAQIQAELASSVGADYRILDPSGRTVAKGEGRRGGADQAASGTAKHDPDGLVLMSQSATERPSAASNLDVLNTDDLVMLDGSKEEAPKSNEALATAQGLAPSVFAPIQEDEELELDDVGTRPSVLTPPPPARPAGGAPAAPVAAPAESAPALEGLVAAAEIETQQAPMLPPTPAALPSAVRSRQPSPERRAPSRAPGSASSIASEPRRSSRLASARQQGVERVLFGGWFRQHTRLRIVVGFAMALALGSIGPIFQSRSVVNSKIRPELEELATSRAYPALARLPNYRMPEEIEKTISGIKSRNGFSSFLIWLASSALLTFLWFRFV